MDVSGLKPAICAFCLTILTAGLAINEDSAIAPMISKIFHVPTVVLALSTMATTPAGEGDTGHGIARLKSCSRCSAWIKNQH